MENPIAPSFPSVRVLGLLSALLFLFFLFFAVRPSGAGLLATAQSDDVIASDLKGFGQRGMLADMRWPDFSDYRKLFQTVYEATDYKPVWLDHGQATKQALAVIQALEYSETKGLNPEEYDGSRWSTRLLALKGSNGNDPNLQATFDAALTVSTMRYISDLHIGRVNPAHFKFGISIEQKKYDLPAFLLNKVAHSSDVQAVLDDAEPQYEPYRRTEAVLQRYLKIQLDEKQNGGLALLPIPSRTVKPGDTYPGVELLAKRLRLVGDLPQDAAPDGFPENKYAGALVDAVRHFQMRHGLAQDGNLGRTTIRELNTPIGMRVLQLDDALERWRWLPPQYAVPPVVVNIPEFVLRAFDGHEQVALAMNVVVGKSYGHQSPIFTEAMKYIVFRPYWNVPQSIVRSEILPAIGKNSGYLAAKHFEVTDFRGRVLSSGPVSPELLAMMRAGKVMVRQKPGPDNALGLVKFIFPNQNSVYLHSTPATQLFSQTRRDFSHGCIRVQKPVELAAWLLRNQPPWNIDTIRAAMNSGQNNRTVQLTTPVPVLIFYITAIVKGDGEAYFFDDIYGLDQSLNKVLSKGPPFP